MRVTGNTFTDSLSTQLNSLVARQYKLQNQAATGLRIQNPEDDPVAMQNTLNLRAQNSALQQYSSNVNALQDRASAAYNSLNELKTKSDRAGEIATLADGISSPTDFQTYATEVNQLIQEAAQYANAKSGDQYLFAGTHSNQPPYVVVTDANGQVTSVTYQGNESTAATPIDSATNLSVDVPGANTSGTGAHGLITDSRSGADFFNHLISLRDHLAAGNTAAVTSTDIPALGKDEDNILYQVASNGVTQSRLQTSAAAITQQTTTLQQNLSTNTDADMAQTLLQLSQTQTAYQAALQSSSKILNMSLMNYLQ